MKSFLIFSLLICTTTFAKVVDKKTTPAEAAATSVLSFKETDGAVGFHAVGKPAMIKIDGEGTGPYGDLTLADGKLSGSLSIDMKKLTTKIELRDDHMKNKYLEVDKFPASIIIFKDYSLNLDSSSDQPFSAELQLHGITKPVSGTIKLSKQGTALTGQATFKIKVTDYMDTLPSYAGIKIADEVQVKVDLKTTTK